MDVSVRERPSDGGHPLAPYFPRLTIDWLHNSPEVRFREVLGSVAFVDISGFTKLSEGLAKHGKVGAEELTATIGTCFVSLLDIAVANGGRLLKFGGDALLLLFTGEAHEARACRAASRHAPRSCGWWAASTVLGQRVSLRMSVGVHSGRFHFFLVGDSHRELIVTGPGASTTVTMEGTAEAGEIVISPDTAAGPCAAAWSATPRGTGSCCDGPRPCPRTPFVPFEIVDPRRGPGPRAFRWGCGTRWPAPGRTPSTAGSPWPSCTSTGPTPSSSRRAPR